MKKTPEKMKVHISIDSSTEIVVKGKVDVYAIKNGRNFSLPFKTSAKSTPPTLKNEHMRKYVPKAGSTKKGELSKNGESAKKGKPAKEEPVEVQMTEYEKGRQANIAQNNAYLERLGLKSPSTPYRNVISPRKPARTSPRKSPVKTSKSVKRKLDDVEDNEWVPKKQKYLLADDTCKDFYEGRWLRCSELHFVHKALCLGDPKDVRDNAVPYDYFIQVITDRFRNKTDLPWDCCIINTAPKTSRRSHWNLTMWRLHRKRVQVTLWEPYNHNKYSAHIKAELAETFPTASITSFTPGAQKRGDGWRCGYICVWWQILVMKLIAEGSAPRVWKTPTDPPQLWVSLVWTVLRERMFLLESDKDEDLAIGHVRAQVAELWKQCVDSGSLSADHLEEMQTLLDLQGLTVHLLMFESVVPVFISNVLAVDEGCFRSKKQQQQGMHSMHKCERERVIALLLQSAIGTSPRSLHVCLQEYGMICGNVHPCNTSRTPCNTSHCTWRACSGCHGHLAQLTQALHQPACPCPSPPAPPRQSADM